MDLGESFAQVLAAARANADWAWAELYRDLAPRVLGYLRARRVPDAEDLAGEVFVGVVRDLHRFEGDQRDFRAWVLTIAHRRLVDRYRRGSHAPAESPVADFVEASGPVGDAEADAMERLGTERVRSLLAKLSPDQQDVLLLRLLGDLTIEEVASAVGKRPTAVKALQRRALAALRREISRQGVSL